jgi:hypothetical protein
VRKLSEAQKRRLIRRAQWGGISAPKSAELAAPVYEKLAAPALAVTSFITFTAPEYCSFSGNTKATLAFLERIRVEADRRVRGRRITADLSTIRDIDLSAALALVAEFDRWQRKHNTRLKPHALDQWNDDVRRKLGMLGFFDLLNVELPKRHLVSPNYAWIPFTSDVRTVGKAILLLRTRLERHLGRRIPIGRELYGSLVEAMKNAFQHAYPSGTSSIDYGRIGKRWWMAGQVDLTDGEVKFAFLDQGVTIPYSLETSWMWDDISADIDIPSDALRVAAAVKYGNSRLKGEDHRGKGFSDILWPASMCERNVVRILSRNCYAVKRGQRQLVAIDMDFTYPGTLIEWEAFPDTSVREEA